MVLRINQAAVCHSVGFDIHVVGNVAGLLPAVWATITV